MAEHGEVAWIELNTWEPDKAKAFYEATLDWRFDSMPVPGSEDQTYLVGMKNDKAVAGIYTMTSPTFDGLPSHWLTYFEVADVDASAKAVVDAGGAVKRQPFDIPTIGRIAIVVDATGAVSGYMTSARQEEQQAPPQSA